MALQSAAFARAAFDEAALARPLSTLAALGDSMTFQNADGTPWWKRPYGYLSWAEILSGGRLISPAEFNFGVSGERSDQMLARVGRVVAARPDICVVFGGVNDLPTLTAAQTIRNLERIYDRLRDAGIFVVAVPPIPAGVLAGQTLTDAQQAHLAQVRHYIRARSIGGGFAVADAGPLLLDHASSKGLPIGGAPAGSSIPTAMTYDGLHPSIRGAFWIGKTIAGVLESRLCGRPPILDGAHDQFDALTNPTGSKLGPALALGTPGGTVSGGASGTAPAGWVLQRQSAGGSLTGAFETQALANGTSRPAYRITASGSQASGEARGRLYRQIYSSYAPGEKVEGLVEVEVSGIGPSSLTELQLQVADTTGQLARVLGTQAGVLTGTKFCYPDQTWSGVLRTSPIVLGNTAALDFVVNLGVAGIDGASASVTLTGAKLARCIS